MSASPPLRFLMAVVGGWVCLRAVMLFPDFPEKEGRAAPVLKVAAGPDAAVAAAARAAERPRKAEADRRAFLSSGPFRPFLIVKESREEFAAIPAHAAEAGNRAAAPAEPHPAPVPFAPAAPPSAGPALAAGTSGGRWSASAWLFVRRDAPAGPLAPGGTLGGSQAGGRLLYRLNGPAGRPLSLSGRLYVPLNRLSGAEASIGLDWQPVSGMPVRLLAERREALGRDGRSAFGLTIYGGVDGRRLPAGLRLDAYGQAGVVGLESRDLFVDGAVRVGAPAGPVEIGGGAWGAAQPGVSRLDVGPQASIRLPIRDASLRLFADWRFRVAGDAPPDSGPTITLATDF